MLLLHSFFLKKKLAIDFLQLCYVMQACKFPHTLAGGLYFQIIFESRLLKNLTVCQLSKVIFLSSQIYQCNLLRKLCVQVVVPINGQLTRKPPINPLFLGTGGKPICKSAGFLFPWLEA